MTANIIIKIRLPITIIHIIYFSQKDCDAAGMHLPALHTYPAEHSVLAVHPAKHAVLVGLHRYPAH